MTHLFAATLAIAGFLLSPLAHAGGIEIDSTGIPAPGTSGNVLTSNGSAWTSAATASTDPAEGFTRWNGWWRWTEIAAVGSSTVAGAGMITPTLLSGATGSCDVDVIGGIIACVPVTGTALNDKARIYDPNYASFKATALPRMSLKFSFSSATSISNVRAWVCLGTSNDPTASATPALHHACLRYDTGAGDTKWKCCMGDGTTTSCTTTNVAPSNDWTVPQVLSLSMPTSSTLSCTVGTTTVTHATNPPSTTQAIGPSITLTNLSAGAGRAMSVGAVAFSAQ